MQCLNPAQTKAANPLQLAQHLKEAISDENRSNRSQQKQIKPAHKKRGNKTALNSSQEDEEPDWPNLLGRPWGQIKCDG